MLVNLVAPIPEQELKRLSFAEVAEVDATLYGEPALIAVCVNIELHPQRQVITRRQEWTKIISK